MFKSLTSFLLALSSPTEFNNNKKKSKTSRIVKHKHITLIIDILIKDVFI